MAKIKLTDKQAKLFGYMTSRKEGSFVLDEAIDEIFGSSRPNFPRQKAISVINGIKRKLYCKCCYLLRTSDLGRGKVGSYKFRIICKSEKEK